MTLPESFLRHLRERGYHPRSDKHSKALCEAIVEALVVQCPTIARESAAGQLVFDHNCDVSFGNSTWNTDLAIGKPPPGLDRAGLDDIAGMARTVPSTIRIAIEAKAVMTEHRKAVKNRKRDLEAHHQHAHDYDPNCIAGGIVVVNASRRFRSPLRSGREPTEHNDPKALIEHCVREINAVTMAHGSNRVGLDAKCVLVLSMGNIAPHTVEFVDAAPAPPVGSPIHWDAFIQRICDAYGSRF